MLLILFWYLVKTCTVKYPEKSPWIKVVVVVVYDDDDDDDDMVWSDGNWEMHRKFWLEDMKWRDHSEDLGIAAYSMVQNIIWT
jgi:hypothetical protein